MDDDGLRDRVTSAALIGVVAAELLVGQGHDRAGLPVHLPDDHPAPPPMLVVTVPSSFGTGVIDDDGAAWQQTLQAVAIRASLGHGGTVVTELHVPDELPVHPPPQATEVQSGGPRHYVLNAEPGHYSVSGIPANLTHTSSLN